MMAKIEFPDRPIRMIPQDLGQGVITVNPMHAPFGVDEEHTCAQCTHLVSRSFASTYLKCAMRSLSYSESSDHRSGWIACGLFEERLDQRR